MGKYDEKIIASKTDATDTNLILNGLEKIANELAEANRLKRIEITVLGANLDVPKTFSEAREDRA